MDHPTPTKVIWLSDLHFTHNGLVQGHDPRVRLDHAISHINDLHDDADFCVISGDMVNRGTEQDYTALAAQLQALKIPYFPMTGNHDNRLLFRQSFAMPSTLMDEFVQYSHRTKDGLFLCLDTLKSGADAGELCDIRLAWLRNQLDAAGESPVYIFMHHPPGPLGLPMQDQDCLENADVFLDVITAYPCVKHLLIGHVHRPITGTIRGIPFATMRSVLYQAPAPRPAWDWSTFHPSAEAPSLGVLTISNGNLILQYEQFCAAETGVQ